MSDRMPEDLERSPVLVEEGPAVETAPVPEPATPAEWIRRNLFPGWFNSVFTVVLGTFVVWAGYRLLRFVFVTGDWEVFRANLRVYMVGRFPLDEIWRVWASVYLVIAMSGLSWGASGARLIWTRRKVIGRAVFATISILLLVWLLEGLRIWLLVGACPVIFAGAVAAGRRAGRRLRRPLMVGWVLVFPAVVFLLMAFGGVPPQRWSGFLLNILVAVVAIFASFPLGLLLALGRRSKLRAVSLVCVLIIELVRGVPLITLLIFGQFIVPLLLPPGSALPDIIRAMVMITAFSAAYVAEIVRGGLQGVDAGQYEAARALGLSTSRMMVLVILPQALRNTIPAMIGHFISLFKDTSLLSVLGGFSELLRTARRASRAFEFVGRAAEALIPAAVIFFLVAFSMSRWSQRMERRLGVGER